MIPFPHKKTPLFYAFLLIVIVGIVLGIFLLKSDSVLNENEVDSTALFKKIEDPYIAFTLESYESIKKNYWEAITDEQLSELFRLALNHVTKETFELSSKDELGVQNMITNVLDQKPQDTKKDLTALIVHTVLQNLQPLGRSALYTTVEEKKLRETVANIDSEKNIYDTLSLNTGASIDEVEKAYEEKKKELEGNTSEEAKKKLEEIEYAKVVLGDEAKKAQYDENKIEPTVLTEVVSPNILYMKIPVLSPQTFNEFIGVSDSITDEKLNTLILDIRGNIGGAIDTLQWFLGPFIGPNQYAYDFFHQGEYTPYKTQVGWLPSLTKYKRVVILIDKNSQSSAEVMAATFTKYNVGILVGEPTKGWGTVENTFPLETKVENTTYSLYLVHSITLRPDGQPVEGRGVDPMIYVNDPKWKEQLNVYFNDNKFISAVEKFVNKK